MEGIDVVSKCIFRKKMIYKKLFRSEKDFHENSYIIHGNMDIINIIFWRAEYEEFDMDIIIQHELDFSQIIFGF